MKDEDDDDFDFDESSLMNEPLQLITNNRGMKVDSGLLRQKMPAVILDSYKY